MPEGLFKLPSEVRAKIFRLSLEPKTRYIDLQFVEGKSPRRDLLLTNHQIYREALWVYETTYESASRKFWTKTRFEVDLDDGGRTWDRFLSSTSAPNLRRIKHIVVTNSFLRFNGSRVRLILTKTDALRHLWELGWEDDTIDKAANAHRCEWPVTPGYVALLLLRLRADTPIAIGPLEIDLRECQKRLFAEQKKPTEGQATIEFMGLSLSTCQISHIVV